MRYDSTSGFSALDFGGHNQGLLYQGVLNSAWLVEASLAHAASDFRETVSVDEWQFVDESVTPSTTVGGKGLYEGQNDGDSLQLRARSTHLLGRHELRYGFTGEDVHSDATRDITGPHPASDAGGPRPVPWDDSGDPEYGPSAGDPLPHEPRSHQLGDQLRPAGSITAADGLTLSAGLATSSSASRRQRRRHLRRQLGATPGSGLGPERPGARQALR
jgi:hypothetical protein